jgi:drug/metabolite transporter (DMT)-like permease
MNSLEKLKAISPLIAATTLWGTTYTTIKYGLSELHLSPITFLFLRFTIAFLSLVPLLLVKRFRAEIFWTLGKPDIIILGILNGIIYVLQFIGQARTTAGIATIMLNTYVLFTPIFGRFILENRIDFRQKTAVVVGFFGVVVITLGDFLSVRSETVSLAGSLLVFGAGITAGLYVAYSEKVFRMTYKEKSLNPLTVFFSSTLFTYLTIFITGLFLKDLPGFTDVPSSAFIPIVYLGVACTSGAFILYLTSVKRVGAVNSAVLMLFQIIVSMILAYLFLREIPDQFVYFGTPLIFLSFYLVRK